MLHPQSMGPGGLPKAVFGGAAILEAGRAWIKSQIVGDSLIRKFPSLRFLAQKVYQARALGLMSPPRPVIFEIPAFFLVHGIRVAELNAQIQWIVTGGGRKTGGSDPSIFAEFRRQGLVGSGHEMSAWPKATDKVQVGVSEFGP